MQNRKLEHLNENNIHIHVIKNSIIVQCKSCDLIGLAAMVYGPFFYQEIATIKLSSYCSCKATSVRSSQYFLIVLRKTIILRTLVGCEMIIASSGATHLVCYPILISNARLWNYC